MIYLKVDSQIAQKRSDLGTFSALESWIMCYNERHSAEMVHNLPLTNKVDGRSFHKHVRATHGSESPILAKDDKLQPLIIRMFLLSSPRDLLLLLVLLTPRRVYHPLAVEQTMRSGQGPASTSKQKRNQLANRRYVAVRQTKI